MQVKRVTLFAGHYGSGKTNIAVNWALFLRGQGYPVTIADLDIVNPYFRTKDSADELSAAGIRLIASAFANSNVDIPALPGELYAVTDDRTAHAVLDVGGDDRGALALGRYVPSILEENDYEMLAVINRYRPLTDTPEATLEVLQEVQSAAGIPLTGLVNNSNLGALATAQTVLDSVGYAERVSSLTGLPIVMTTVRADLVPALCDRIPDLFPLRLQKRTDWRE